MVLVMPGMGTQPPMTESTKEQNFQMHPLIDVGDKRSVYEHWPTWPS